MADINWTDWLNREHITLDDALLLSMEENPDNPGINQDYDETKYIELRDKAEHWILISRELQAIGELNNGSQEFKNINPLSFFKLARLNGWFLPKPVNDFLDIHQKQQIVTWSGDIQALEPLTAEQRQAYNKLAAWTWVDAIYILQGFKPCPQISTEQVRSHFPNDVEFFTKSIWLGNIGKKIIEAGQRTFIGSPARWEDFWQDKLKAEQQAEAVGNAGAVDGVAIKPASAKSIKANSNEFSFSGLLHIPSGVDDWFEVIDVMTKAFYANKNAMPTKAQAWAELCTNTPIGYGIESMGNQSLTMPGVAKEFNKRSFGRRWGKYTAKSNPFKPN
ncbi:MAG: hypothetical protein Q8L79_05555 [Methylobacter sp.]|uniref:hypothetical protein n=1 Tax=Methylobacter sp. TaxID=2051955 RepID=UPI00273172A7|nr:hypothetical protein [Methylobacter sp.]MDP1664577.1 hypothetical protein [Methylobacter sp.]